MTKRKPSRNQFTPLLLQVDEAAYLAGISRSTLYALMNRGVIASIKIGRARRIPRAELERFIKDKLNDQHN